MGLLHTKLKLCGADERPDVNLVSSIINSSDRNEFLAHIEKLLHYRKFELPKRFLGMVKSKVKVHNMELTEKIRWIEELKSCVIEFYQINSYPIKDRSKLPTEIRTFETLQGFLKDLFWEMTVERDLLSDSSFSGTGSLLNYAPICYTISSKKDETKYVLSGEEPADFSDVSTNNKSTIEVTADSVKSQINEHEPPPKSVSNNFFAAQKAKFEELESAREKNKIDNLTINTSEEKKLDSVHESMSENNTNNRQIDNSILNHFYSSEIVDDKIIKEKEDIESYQSSPMEITEESDDNIFFPRTTRSELNELGLVHKIIESERESITSLSSSENEHFASPSISKTLSEDFKNIVELKYSKVRPLSSLSDQNIGGFSTITGDDTSDDGIDEVAEAINLYKKRFKQAESTVNLKRNTILNRPQSYSFGESPSVKNYIKGVVRIQIYTYFNFASHAEFEKKTLKFKMSQIGTNETDPSSILIKNNPILIDIAVKTWVNDLDQLYRFYKSFFSFNNRRQEWLQFEKSFIPLTISKVVGYVTFMQLVEMKSPKVDFLDKKIIEPILTAIIRQLQHPLYHKNYDYYRIPSNFKKIVPKLDIKKIPEGLLIEMGVIKTDDERLDIEKFTQKFSNSVVFENLLYEENTYWNITYSEKVLELFKISDQIFDDILDDCIQEISEYFQAPIDDPIFDSNRCESSEDKPSN